MKIAELMDGKKIRKGMKLDVRVPTRLVDKLGAKARGELVSVKREGKVAEVRVNIGGKTHAFRAQDLSPA